MKILTGIDLVYLPRFKKSLKSGGENFLRRVFLDSELVKTNPEHLAGIFALKEAVIKALSLDGGSWLDIKIEHDRDGIPKVTIIHPQHELKNHTASIAHDGNYAIAQFVAIIEQ